MALRGGPLGPSARKPTGLPRARNPRISLSPPTPPLVEEPLTGLNPSLAATLLTISPSLLLLIMTATLLLPRYSKKPNILWCHAT